jgi:hypothetical protein
MPCCRHKEAQQLPLAARKHVMLLAAAQQVPHLTDFLLKALAAVVESALEAVGCCVLKAFLQVNNAAVRTQQHVSRSLTFEL